MRCFGSSSLWLRLQLAMQSEWKSDCTMPNLAAASDDPATEATHLSRIPKTEWAGVGVKSPSSVCVCDYSLGANG